MSIKLKVFKTSQDTQREEKTLKVVIKIQLKNFLSSFLFENKCDGIKFAADKWE